MAFVLIKIGCPKLFIASPGHSALIAGRRAVAPHQKSAIPFQWIRLCPLESPRAPGTTLFRPLIRPGRRPCHEFRFFTRGGRDRAAKSGMIMAGPAIATDNDDSRFLRDDFLLTAGAFDPRAGEDAPAHRY
jgi:hypothetical protein